MDQFLAFTAFAIGLSLLYHRNLGRWIIIDQVLFLTLSPASWKMRASLACAILIAGLSLQWMWPSGGSIAAIVSMLSSFIGLNNLLAAYLLRTIDAEQWGKYYHSLVRLKSQLKNHEGTELSGTLGFARVVKNGRFIEIQFEDIGLTLDTGSVMAVWKAKSRDFREKPNVALEEATLWLQEILRQLESRDCKLAKSLK